MSSAYFPLYTAFPAEIKAQIADDAIVTGFPMLSSIAKGPTFAYRVDPDAQLDLSHVDRAMRARSLYTKARAEVTSILNATGLKLPTDPRATPEERRMWELIENGTVKELVFATGRPGDSDTSPGFARATKCLDYITQHCQSHAIETLTFDENIWDRVQGTDKGYAELDGMTWEAQNLMKARGSTCSRLQVRARPNTTRRFHRYALGTAPISDSPPTATIWGDKRMDTPHFPGAYNSILNFDVTGAEPNKVLDLFKTRCRARVQAMNAETEKNPSSALTTTINLYATLPPSANTSRIRSNEQLIGLADYFVDVAKVYCPAGSTNSLVVNVGHCDPQSYRVHQGRRR